MADKEIQIGEYIRTKSGNIGKVLDITNVTMQKRKKYLIKWNISKAYYITLNIINHDFDIIKLIEVGDYVNGIRVDAKTEGYIIFSDGCGDIEVFASDIQTIVTKEQFKSMEYEVGEDD